MSLSWHKRGCFESPLHIPNPGTKNALRGKKPLHPYSEKRTRQKQAQVYRQGNLRETPETQKEPTSWSVFIKRRCFHEGANKAEYIWGMRSQWNSHRKREVRTFNASVTTVTWTEVDRSLAKVVSWRSPVLKTTQTLEATHILTHGSTSPRFVLVCKFVMGS